MPTTTARATVPAGRITIESAGGWCWWHCGDGDARWWSRPLPDLEAAYADAQASRGGTGRVVQHSEDGE